ncbi:MAG: DNA polymerase III subunit beta [Limnochordia bacterium]
MELRCEQNLLLKAVTAVERAVAQRDVKPILTGILLEARNGELYLAASDLEMRIEGTIPVETIQEGQAVVEGKYFAPIVRKLPGGDVFLRYDEGNNSVSLRAGRAHFSLPTIAGEAFPPAPVMEEGSFSCSIAEELFKGMLRQTVFAAAPPDEIRPFLKGIYLAGREGELHMVATDSSRLAIRKKDALSLGEFKALVPARSMQELARLLPGEEEGELRVQLGSNQILFHVGGFKFYSRLIESEFPDYLRVIPQGEPTCKVICSRSQLEEAIDRVSLLVRSGPALIDFKIEEGVLGLSLRSSTAGAAWEELDVTQEGDGLQICLQARYLLEGLRVAEGEEVTMAFYGDNGPMVFTPREGTDFTYLVMPVRT